MEKLEDLGARVSYNDPYIPEIKPSREYARYARRQSVEITTGYDLVLVATAHDLYREIDLLSFAIPVVDTRHLVRGQGGLLYQA
jgi:UDP-N-acetyl-D-glucosamine dehydrogenase